MEKSQKIFLVAVAVIALLLILFGFPKASSKAIDAKTYQAVFLTNGQVYFGKFSKVKAQYPELRDVYYLRKDTQQLQENESTDQSPLALIKLGKEIHGPMDEMFLQRNHILFWENLRQDSEVVQAILQQKAKLRSAQ